MFEQHIASRGSDPAVIGIAAAPVPLDCMPRLGELDGPTVRIPTNLHPAFNRTDRDNQSPRNRRPRADGWDTNTCPTVWPEVGAL